MVLVSFGLWRKSDKKGSGKMKQTTKKPFIRVKTKHGKKMTTLGVITGLFSRPVDYRGREWSEDLKDLAREYLKGNQTPLLNILNQQEKTNLRKFLGK